MSIARRPAGRKRKKMKPSTRWNIGAPVIRRWRTYIKKKFARVEDAGFMPASSRRSEFEPQGDSNVKRTLVARCAAGGGHSERLAEVQVTNARGELDELVHILDMLV